MNHVLKSILLLFVLASFASGQAGKFVMVFLNTDPNREQLSQAAIDSLQVAHLANIQRLSNEGKLIISSRFDEGGGIFVLATASKDTAQMWLSTDPAIRSKRWLIEAYPYVPRIGSICKVVVQYEMATYAFVRFQWKDGNPMGHLMQVASPDLIVAAGMLEGNGSILVVKGTVNEENIRNDPAVKDGMIDVTVKKLWIAKGSFCEK